MYKTKKISIPIYDGWLIVILSDDIELCQSKHQYFEDDVEIYGHSIADHTEKNRRYFVFVNPNHELWKTRGQGVIAHEALHIVHFLFQDVGAELKHDNPEPQCYLVEWIARQISLFIDASTT